MTDPFESVGDSLIAPARKAFAVIPSDADELSEFTKAIYVGSGGTLVLRPVGSDMDVTFANLQDGSILDVRCRAIRASGTTASNIVGLS